MSKNEFLTPHTVREIHKLLRNAFNQAVKWELMSRNPVEHATLPKEEETERNIWTAETLFKALDVCDDDILSLALNLAFSCSLRMGEMLGLTWDCIDISQTSIEQGRASIFVNKELQRVNRDALEKLDDKGVIMKFPAALSSTSTRLVLKELDDKGVIMKFPAALSSTSTRLVLKEPKTKTSIRKVFLPKTVAEMLIARKKEIEELKELFGSEFTDYQLVFCSTNGRPMEGQVINRALNKLIREHDLPKIVFHSLRHSSITYKLKLNGGDMKSVQGDSGHAQAKMVADVYSHIIDEDRMMNAKRFEETFYSPKKEDAGKEQGKEADSAQESDQELLMKLLAKPEMAVLLKTLAKEEVEEKCSKKETYRTFVLSAMAEMSEASLSPKPGQLLFPGGIRRHRLNLKDAEGRTIGYLSFPDDRLYYVIIPLFEQRRVQVKIMVTGNGIRKKYCSLKLWIRLPEKTSCRQPENLNQQIERLLKKYQLYGSTDQR